MNDIQTNFIVRTVYKSIQDFYSNPVNVQKFEEWKKERDKKRKDSR